MDMYVLNFFIFLIQQVSLFSNLHIKQHIKTVLCKSLHYSIHNFLSFIPLLHDLSLSLCLPFPLSLSIPLPSAAYFLTSFCLFSPQIVSSVQF